MNACKLIVLYASDDLRQHVASAVQNGSMIGVWGADDPADPLRIDRADVTSEDAVELSGSKRFASGLKFIDLAVITVTINDGAQLYLVPTDDPARADLTGWNMNGMRATRSGAYDFSGIVVRSDDALGSPGDYTREPHFEGGVWRYCAVHLGAMEAIYALTRDELIERNRSNHPSQQQRLVEMALEIECARGLIQRAAYEVEAAEAAAGKAVLSLLAREKTHTAGKKVIQLSEDALGMSAHATGSPGERLRRDLSLFLCQAAPDAKRSRIAEALVLNRRLPEEL